jgi:hypothetical protein
VWVGCEGYRVVSWCLFRSGSAFFLGLYRELKSQNA